MAQTRRVIIGDRWVDLDAIGNEIRSGPINPQSIFESGLSDLQAASKKQKFNRALRGLMTTPLPKAGKNLMR